jgi:hypothetical protein
MKKALISIFLSVVVLSLIAFPGCKGTITGGNTVTEKKDVTNFTTLDIGSAFEVDIKQSDTYSLTIEADESLIDYIEVTQTGTSLRIYLSPRHIFTDFTLGSRKMKAIITMPNLYSLALSGASKGTVTGFNSQANLNLEVSGATTLKLVNMAAGNVQAEVSGASTMTGNLTAADANFIVSGASTMNLTGLANIMVIEVSGASRAELEQFKTKIVTSEVSGASTATIHVEQTLNVEVSGASSLYFVGNPTLGTTNISGASTIKHKD